MTSPLDRLKSFTRARIALGRAGDALPTQALLDLSLAHAFARDAIHSDVNWQAMADQLAPLPSVMVTSAASGKITYLRRPDLGRVLAKGEAERLPQGPFDIVCVMGDGLSAEACMGYAAATWRATLPLLSGFSIAPIILARGARVALSDEIGAAMGAALVILLIGERPGLSNSDSLGAYLTFAPSPGRKDSERNCISNIHGYGLAPERAAQKIAWLAREALRLKLTGIDLKEDAPDGALPAPPASS